tara:strand:+ start:282 stop:560 length:279 start_codon:yes stop_codon:yes gene_type:complete
MVVVVLLVKWNGSAAAAACHHLLAACCRFSMMQCWLVVVAIAASCSTPLGWVAAAFQIEAIWFEGRACLQPLFRTHKFRIRTSHLCTYVHRW